MEGEYGKLSHCIGMLWHMPDIYSASSFVEWGGGQRTEIIDTNHVRFSGTECRLFIVTDGAYTGSFHDCSDRGKCGFRFCAALLLLVYLYLLLHSSAKNIFKNPWSNQFLCPAFGVL